MWEFAEKNRAAYGRGKTLKFSSSCPRSPDLTPETQTGFLIGEGNTSGLFTGDPRGRYTKALATQETGLRRKGGMDKFTKEIRSKIMASVRSRGNRSTELALGRILWKSGLRGYRKHWPVAGRPDFAWPSLKVAIFVDGCFWHGCGRCKDFPKSNANFWREKIETNKRRDRRVTRNLQSAGWAVIRIKECRLLWPNTLRTIAEAVNNSRRSGEST
jgi:DNA mismatch endonuclease (patch repair protein)